MPTLGKSQSPISLRLCLPSKSHLTNSGSWETAVFKPYNFEALGQKNEGGYLHPLMKVRAEYREIFLEMGFEEMPTNLFVESAFWNFDTLFQPQQHPARDAHDTFFVAGMKLTDVFRSRQRWSQLRP